MTLYGIGLGPGATNLLTVRGKRRLESVDVVYSPGRLSRRVAAEYVPESKLSVGSNVVSLVPRLNRIQLS